MIALVIIRRTHTAHRTDKGAENPTGPKLPDFTLSEQKLSEDNEPRLMEGKFNLNNSGHVK